MGLRGTATLRFAALLLVVLVCTDVALDAACEPGAASATRAATVMGTAPAAGPSDACARFCVPDCFCCSISETALAATTLPTPAEVAALPDPRPSALNLVNLPVPELPPLVLS